VSDAVRSAVKDLTSGGRPDGAAMQVAFEAIFRGESDPALTAAFLTSLAMRGESASDIAAGAAVMRAHVRRVAAPPGAIDTCGTGGLPWISLNTSTAAAFVAAGAGAVVAKHGNRSVPPKTGSADVLEALGVNLNPTDAQLEASFAKAGVAFMFAPAHHAAMKHVAPVRKALGIRTVFNLLGPLANPAGARRQLLGVYSDLWLIPYAKALRSLGSERAWVVHGKDGMDEISTTGPTTIAELKDGEIETFDIHPQDLGIAVVDPEVLRGGTPAENAAALQQVLEGKPGPFADLVAVNAAAALALAGRAADLADGLSQARASIASGRALAALDALKSATNG
jgi:anthranilate phosphoribosyltransferase